MARSERNPILSPSKKWWEIEATFNPAATVFENQILLLYRAVGGDGLSRFGLAKSSTGEEFERYDDPILEGDPKNPDERLGIEDPRISKIGETFYITYTAVSVYPDNEFEKGLPSLSHPAPWRVRPALTMTKDFKKFEPQGVLFDKDSKDAVLFPEKIDGYFVLLHRVYPKMYLAFSKDLKNWEKEKIFLDPRENSWDSERVGAAAPPIKTEKGWLVFYHGVDAQHIYRLGYLILDLLNPAEILYRSDQALLSPETEYEKRGVTANVIFASGAIEKEKEIFLYYGAADKYIGLAKLKKEELLEKSKTAYE